MSTRLVGHGAAARGAGAARSQSPGTTLPVEHQQILSVNPITSIFKVFGGRAGVHHVAVDVDTSIDVPSANLFGAGVDIGYSWLLGSKRNIGVRIGLGAERFGTLSGAALTIPSLRLVNIGIAFW